ncbi:39S ribosomal protein L33, mitochondrial isoform X2 [Lontra canadensis]|uniref:39S ribosomal protein L33, mitochondrial isoform X2 n=1 Tax=Lontra canadensis TaxID=76717 RepID=UPI0013F2CA15|nr:39S ribosomal protein L33, mitochondrial isoform X2 [Lontra canadensis]
MNTTNRWRPDWTLKLGGRGSRQLLDVLFRNRPVPRKQLFVERLWARLGDCGCIVTMFLSAVTLKTKVLFVEQKKIRSL